MLKQTKNEKIAATPSRKADKSGKIEHDLKADLIF